MKICSQCSEKIDESRLYDPIIICQNCGAVEKKVPKTIQSADYWTFVYNTFFILVIFVASVFYLKRWDKHIIKAAPLEVRSVLGIASIDELNLLTDLCEKQNNYSCVIKVSEKIISKDPHNAEAYAKQGHVHFLKEEYSLAAAAYRKYRQAGGVDEQALYEYAISLSRSGQTFLALHMFETILNSKQDVLQISVYEHYIKTLIDNGELKKAIKTIEFVQKKASKSFDFMQTELDQLKKRG